MESKKDKLSSIANYVILTEEDAHNILYMLNGAINRLKSGKRRDDVVEVFGDHAIYHTRLIDLFLAINGDNNGSIKSVTIDRGHPVGGGCTTERFWFRCDN